METVLILVVVSFPILALAGLVVAIAALIRLKTLRLRVDEIDGRAAAHPIAQRLRDLQSRVAALEQRPSESGPPVEPVSVASGPEPESAPSAAPAQPAFRSDERPPAAPAAVGPRPSVPPPVAVPKQDEAAPAAAAPPPSEPPRPARTRPTRASIDWERWIGVRGAAAAGGVVLALASLLFFQYSIEHGLISPTMRVVFGVIVGIACLVGSQWLVKRDQEAVANALAGAGVVVLYGATWAAENLYGLIGGLPAGVLMVLITVVCVTLAVRREARFIAALGLLGGFATPLLVTTGIDSPAALFGYILLLDLGVLWLARARGWPLLSLLSLIGTALHQALWILADLDAERAGLGLVILAVFGVVFLLSTGLDREPSLLSRATRAGGVAIPFAFALHFAAGTGLAENPVPLGVLLLILSAGACWLESRETRGAAATAAGASLGIMTLWFVEHRLSTGLAWQAVAMCTALAAVFTAAAEIASRRSDERRLGLAALVSSLGMVTLLALASVEGQVVRPWPWVAGWVVLGGFLVLHSRWPGRAWVQIAAGLAPALGLFLAAERHGGASDGLETWAWLGLMVAVAVVFQVVAGLTGDDSSRSWAERTAAATALALMPAVAALMSVQRAEGVLGLAAIPVLGLLAALAATRLRSGGWLLAVTAATAFWHSVVFSDTLRELEAASATGLAFWLLAAAAVAFTVWPAVTAGAFRGSRAGWWGAALAGPFWFVALKAAFVDRFGDGAVGVLPVALGAVAFATVLWVKPRLEDEPGTLRTALVWYLAVALSMVSVAIPLQLENEWVTIGWALNGLAILALWLRFDHPGLKAFGLALLGAATLRLIANPEVLRYHVRAATPVLGWLSYTYLVPAAALVLSHRILRPREVERLRPWEERFYPGNRPFGAAACGLAAVAVVFAWINLAIADVFATGANLELTFRRLPARDAATSVAWAVYALILLAIGVRSKSSSLRWLSLGVIMLTLGKVFLHDLGELEDLYRVGSLVGLALSLIIVSLIYQSFVFRTGSREGG
jgi:hypothetical protein